MAEQSAAQARQELASVVCVDRFMAAADMPVQLSALKALERSYQQGKFVEEGGWAIMPVGLGDEAAATSEQQQRPAQGGRALRGGARQAGGSCRQRGRDCRADQPDHARRAVSGGITDRGRTRRRSRRFAASRPHQVQAEPSSALTEAALGVGDLTLDDRVQDGAEGGQLGQGGAAFRASRRTRPTRRSSLASNSSTMALVA